MSRQQDPPTIEFMRMYVPGTELWRCGGNAGCGALVVSGDMELHTEWHGKMEEALKHARSIHFSGKVRGTW